MAMRWLRTGGSEALLMKIAGWGSPTMVKRYVSSVIDEEAIRAQRAQFAFEVAVEDPGSAMRRSEGGKRPVAR